MLSEFGVTMIEDDLNHIVLSEDEIKTIVNKYSASEDVLCLMNSWN